MFRVDFNAHGYLGFSIKSQATDGPDFYPGKPDVVAFLQAIYIVKKGDKFYFSFKGIVDVADHKDRDDK